MHVKKNPAKKFLKVNTLCVLKKNPKTRNCIFIYSGINNGGIVYLNSVN